MYRIKTKLNVRPILKWAGGKSQLLHALIPKIPIGYCRYVEPFFGGGALFFAVQPENALISDSNPELINLYLQVANNVGEVIDLLHGYKNTPEEFYDMRAQDWKSLEPSVAAARMIYLNRTCFNGLYRVNRKGEFNVPYGRYPNPVICDEGNLRAASELLKSVDIRCADYLEILDGETRHGDFVFLDPPYVPVGRYGDFKRYTKDQFREEDHVRLADAVGRLRKHSIYALLTNSNHPFVHDLYAAYPIETCQTRRNISCDGGNRTGEDVIVTISPASKVGLRQYSEIKLPEQISRYPQTRFMGSKRKLLPEIWKVVSRFEFDSVLDLFSGSGVVGYMFKAQGKRVTCNDYMHMCSTFSKAMIENNETVLPLVEAMSLLEAQGPNDGFVENTFRGLYFSDEENRLIDVVRTNILAIGDEYKRAIAMGALIRACTKKRPRGLFTYTGLRYDDGRIDLRKTLSQQFIEAVDAINAAVFDNGMQNLSRNGNAMDFTDSSFDVVYVDPPYFTPKSDNEYVRRYHFIEGLARNWRGVEIQNDTETRKFKSYPTPFSTRAGAIAAFDSIFERFANSAIVVSYSSNSLPTRDEMVALMKRHKRNVEVVPIDYRYCFGNRGNGNVGRNVVQEYLFVGY